MCIFQDIFNNLVWGQIFPQACVAEIQIQLMVCVFICNLATVPMVSNIYLQLLDLESLRRLEHTSGFACPWRYSKDEHLGEAGKICPECTWMYIAPSHRLGEGARHQSTNIDLCILTHWDVSSLPQTPADRERGWPCCRSLPGLALLPFPPTLLGWTVP